MRSFKMLICAVAAVIAMASVAAQDDLLSLRFQYSQARTDRIKLNAEIASMYHQVSPRPSKEFNELYKKQEQARKYIKISERKFIEKMPEGKDLYRKIDELNKGIKRDLEASDYKKRRIKIAKRDNLKSQIEEKLIESMRSKTIDADVMKANQNYLKCSEALLQYQYDQIKNKPEAKELVEKHKAINAKIAAIRKKWLEASAALKKKNK